MTLKQRTLLLRFARSTAALVLSSVIAFLTGPDVLNALTPSEAVVVTGVLTPFLITLDKFLRFGSDPGEGAPDASDAKA